MKTKKSERNCSVKGCDNPSRVKGFCTKHYQRFHKYGRLHRINAFDGSVYINHHGYKTIRHNGKTVHFHRVIMEKHLGRVLNPEETVHHINGDKLDNRIENLEVMTISEHTTEHHRRRGAYDNPKHICTIEDCNRPYFCRGFCAKHYKEFRKSGKLQMTRHPNGIKNLVCEVNGCDKPQLAKGLCQNHYMLKRKYGRTELIRRPNDVKNLICEVEGCNNPQLAKGLCSKHYKSKSITCH